MITREAIAGLVEEHYDRVYRYARVMSGNDEDARDLAQETFLEALRGLDRFRGGSSISTWLIAILRNRFLLSLRRLRRVHEPRPVSEPPDLPDIGPALDRLSEPVRTTLVMFYYDDMDYASIAQALDCPIGTVRSRLHEGREQLRRILGPALSENAR